MIFRLYQPQKTKKENKQRKQRKKTKIENKERKQNKMKIIYTRTGSARLLNGGHSFC